jgi:POT family proton-dependent oligopeptide transporter
MGDNGKVPFLFVFLGYFLITTGELFLSPIGLSKVTELAPKKIVAFMMGVWFLSSTFAHYISGMIAKLTTSGNNDIESNWLSDLSNWFMGNPDTSNEAVAILLQYNSVYAQIGFVTIFIALFVIMISPFIKKLMHGIH